MQVPFFPSLPIAAAVLVCGVCHIFAQAPSPTPAEPAAPETKPEPAAASLAKGVPDDHPPIVIEKPIEKKELTVEDVQRMLKKISATEYSLNGLKIDLKAGELQVPAVTKIMRGPLEYVLSSENGAVHEALFVTKNNAFELQIALLLMGFKPSETFFTRPDPEAYPQPAKSPKIEPAAQFDLLVDCESKPGTHSTVPVETWIKNLRTEKSLTPGTWVFSGSFISEEGQLAAMGAGNIVALYLDPVSLANNPRQDNELDDNWTPMPDLPAPETPVTIIFRRKLAEPAKPVSPGPEPAAK